MTTQTNYAWVYVGTYTGRAAHIKSQMQSEGIYVYQLNLITGELTHTSTLTGLINPSYLAIEPQKRYLYAVSETEEMAGKQSGGVSACAIDPENGALTLINSQLTQGKAPCHLSVDHSGQYVLSANYSSGSICILPILADGRLGESSDFIQHEGSSINKQRQEGPHAHSINVDKDNRYAFVADLGIDKMMSYQLDLEAGKLVPNSPPWVEIKPGAGPRHFAFSPDSQYAYLINELDSTLITFAYDAGSGRLQELQTLSTLPEGLDPAQDIQGGMNHCADIHVSPSGKFVYGSNRGHDSIAIFQVEPENGKISPIGHEPTQGKTPRNFALDPTGAFLLVANQDTDTIVTFRIEQKTGQLYPTGHITTVPTPVCIKMIL